MKRPMIVSQVGRAGVNSKVAYVEIEKWTNGTDSPLIQEGRSWSDKVHSPRSINPNKQNRRFNQRLPLFANSLLWSMLNHSIAGSRGSWGRYSGRQMPIVARLMFSL
jgi:hypothetical protein